VPGLEVRVFGDRLDRLLRCNETASLTFQIYLDPLYIYGGDEYLLLAGAMPAVMAHGLVHVGVELL
jgi:hypothetical protein